MKTKHTPGPWTVLHDGFDGLYIDAHNRPVVIAEICAESPTEEDGANAQLIATAPEMLDALIAANSYFVDLQNKCALTASDERAWKMISKVIQKATK